MIVVPNKGVVYNEEKAKKVEQEDKLKKLMRLEENRKRRRSKFSGEVNFVLFLTVWFPIIII